MNNIQVEVLQTCSCKVAVADLLITPLSRLALRHVPGCTLQACPHCRRQLLMPPVLGPFLQAANQVVYCLPCAKRLHPEKPMQICDHRAADRQLLKAAAEKN